MNGTSLKPLVRSDHHPRDASADPNQPHPRSQAVVQNGGSSGSQNPSSRRIQSNEELVDPDGFDDWDGEGTWSDEDGSTAYDDMPSDLRPEGRNADGKSQQPLLATKQQEYDQDGRSRSPLGGSQHSSKFHERDSEDLARKATQKKYMYAGLFLGLSLVSFVVQTETAIYIADQLKWRKSYCML